MLYVRQGRSRRRKRHLLFANCLVPQEADDAFDGISFIDRGCNRSRCGNRLVIFCIGIVGDAFEKLRCMRNLLILLLTFLKQKDAMLRRCGLWATRQSIFHRASRWFPVFRAKRIQKHAVVTECINKKKLAGSATMVFRVIQVFFFLLEKARAM